MKTVHTAPTPSQVVALLLDTTPWLSCEDCFEHLDKYAESVAHGAGPASEPMHRPLLGCAACAEELQTQVELLRADPSEDLHDRG